MCRDWRAHSVAESGLWPPFVPSGHSSVAKADSFSKCHGKLKFEAWTTRSRFLEIVWKLKCSRGDHAAPCASQARRTINLTVSVIITWTLLQAPRLAHWDLQSPPSSGASLREIP